MATLERVQDIFRQVLAEDVFPQTTFVSLEMDEIDLADLITEVEVEFDKNIPDNIAETIPTVQGLVDFLDQK